MIWFLVFFCKELNWLAWPWGVEQQEDEWLKKEKMKKLGNKKYLKYFFVVISIMHPVQRKGVYGYIVLHTWDCCEPQVCIIFGLVSNKENDVNARFFVFICAHDQQHVVAIAETRTYPLSSRFFTWGRFVQNVYLVPTQFNFVHCKQISVYFFPKMTSPSLTHKFQKNISK